MSFSCRSLQLLDTVLWLYQIVLIVWVVLSWLVSFNVVNYGQRLRARGDERALGG